MAKIQKMCQKFINLNMAKNRLSKPYFIRIVKIVFQYFFSIALLSL